MMKNRTNLLLSFAVLILFFSLITFSAAPDSTRYSWQGINPWNSAVGLSLLLKRFLSVDAWIIYTLTAGLIAYLWWRIYMLIKRLRER